MPTATVEAVVLRRWDSGENDRTISLLTRERGKVIAVARGARKAGSKLAAITEPTSRSIMQLAHGRRVDYVTQARQMHGLTALRRDLDRLLAALAWLEALDAVLPSGEAHPEVFDLAVMVLEAMNDAKEPLAALCWGDLRLLHISGFSPQFETSVISGEYVRGQVRYLSPREGGAVLPHEVPDASEVFRVPREIAITLAKVQRLEEPPSYMRRSREVADALYKFWIEIAGRDLPARRALLHRRC